jgi:hypothetical protein
MTTHVPAAPVTTPWTKASRSAQGGQCVELRRHTGAVEVRDSKDPAGPRLRLDATGVTRWLHGARRGAFDHLT